MENILEFLNRSGIAVWLIPLLIITIIVIILKGKDILDFENIEKDDVYYKFINYLIKDSFSDKKNIIKIEYKLNDEVKFLKWQLEKILDGKDTKLTSSQKCIIPIFICYQKNKFLEKEISDIKINPQKLEEIYARLHKEQKELDSSQSKIQTYLSYIKKQRRSNLFLNAGLYNAFARKLLSTVQFKETVSDTLIGAMLNKKAKVYTRSYIYLLLPFVLYIGTSILTDIKIEPLLMYANIFFLVSALINQKILEFRIAKGYYGSNEYESREMLRFIAENSDGTNLSGGTGLKPFPAENASESIWVEGCVTV